MGVWLCGCVAARGCVRACVSACVCGVGVCPSACLGVWVCVGAQCKSDFVNFGEGQRKDFLIKLIIMEFYRKTNPNKINEDKNTFKYFFLKKKVAQKIRFQKVLKTYSVCQSTSAK